jgi:citrate lyase subunit beta/citryl-CoA lyase
MKLISKGFAGTLESGDIFIEIEKSEQPGIHIDLQSKVKNQYGKQIFSVITETLKENGITNVNVKAVDQGSLDCTIRARVTTAIYRGCGRTDYRWEEPMKRLRRTMLFVPGNSPGMIRDAHIYGSDSIMFDLEDSVALGEKDAARHLVYQALKFIDYGNIEKVVRVNPLNTAYGKDDIEAMVCAGVDVIRLPKTETPKDILDTENAITEIEKKTGIEIGSTKMMAAIESALGVVNAYPIAISSKRLVGIALGAEDYTASLKTTRSLDGTELFFARSQIIVAARAAGIDAIDTVFSNLNDMETFEKEIRLIKQLGFDGKSVINPRQIDVVHKIFNPTEKEIEKALRILEAMREAETKGSGVVNLDGKMIDKPVLLRAERMIDMAIASGMYYPDDME